MSSRTRRAATAAVLALLTLAGALPAHAAKAAASKAAASRGGRDSVLVRVGREAITWREVQRRIDELPEPYRTNYGTVDGRKQFLDHLIEERVWLLGARKHGVDTRPDVRQQIEQSERDLVIRTYVNEVMAANSSPSDSEARRTTTPTSPTTGSRRP